MTLPLGSPIEESIVCKLTGGTLQPFARALTVIGTLALATPLFGQAGQAEELTSNVKGCNTNDATAPCFANNPDILGGRRHLLNNDDLVLSIDIQLATESTIANFWLPTKDLEIMSVGPGIGAQRVATSFCVVEPPVPAPVVTRFGRIFDLDRDVFVTLAPRPESAIGCAPLVANLVVTWIEVVSEDSITDQRFTTEIGFRPTTTRIAVEDFDRDGFDEVFIIGPFRSQSFNPFIEIYGANDLNDPSRGLSFKLGSNLEVDPQEDTMPRGDPVTGDFNGDNVVDVAWVGGANGGELKIYVVSICPAAGVKIGGETCGAPFNPIVSANTIATGLTWSDSSRDGSTNTVLVAGDLDGVPDPVSGRLSDELVLLKQVTFDDKGKELNSVKVSTYQFDGDLVPTEASDAPIIATFDPVGASPQFFADSARLDWFGPREQVVIGANAKQPNRFGSSVGIYVIAYDQDLAPKVHLDEDNFPDSVRFIRGIAAGRFDPPDASNGDTDFSQQIAVLYTEKPLTSQSSTTPNTRIDFYSVDAPNDFTPMFIKVNVIESDELLADNPRVTSPLVAGDFQGRSLRLGPPEKATVTGHTQPDTILGLPPLHVDFIPSAKGQPPSVFNVSAFPATFNAAYDFMDKSGTTASRMSTTSYTLATKESAMEMVSYGIPDIASVSVTAQQSASQTHSNSVAKTFNSYSSNSFSFSAATKFDDLVAATATQMNVYTYQVLGQTACPEDKPGCTDAEKVPVYVQFSGPDNIIHSLPSGGAGAEWYQPVNMPGNIFSYPGNLTQLMQDAPQSPSGSRLELKSPEDTVWGSQATEAVAVDWSEQNSEDVSAGSTSTHSFDASVSVSGSASFGGFGASASASFDYNKSKSVSTQNTSTQSFGESTGVTQNRGTQVTNPFYRYQGETYIYGQSAPDGTLDKPTLPQTVTAEGFLRVGYAVNPLSSDPITSGDWWKQVYGSTPDLALNHPSHWQTAGTSTGVAFSCPVGLTNGTDGGCVGKGAKPTPANVVGPTTFYQMKGLFITPGDTTAGPAITMAKLGDTLTLRARLYNLSLKNIPDDTDMMAAFYAQPWDDGAGMFLSAPGNSDDFAPATFISPVVKIDTGLPGFCGGSMMNADPCSESDAARNLITVELAWDTSTLDVEGDTYWKIWVVAWLEKDGELVPELEGKGLKEIPGANLNSLADVAVEIYSNNLGFYNQVLTLIGPSDDDALAANVIAEDREIRVEEIELGPEPILKDRTTLMRARHAVTGEKIDSVLVRFFDGDPETGGQMFDTELIPRIQADGDFVTPVPYRPESCGLHDLLVEAIPMGGDVAPATGQITVEVTTDSVADVTALIGTVRLLELPHGIENSLAKKLANARKSFDKGNDGAAMNQLDAFINQATAQSGKKLSESAADILIARADGIIECL